MRIGALAAAMLAACVAVAPAAQAKSHGPVEGIAPIPFECPAKTTCLYDQSDGLGAWQGGFKLEPNGWDNRASAYRDTHTTK